MNSGLGKWFIALAFLSLLSISSSSVRAQILEEDDDSYLQSGFFMAADFGPYLLIAKPATLSLPEQSEAQTLGMSGGVLLGYGITPRFSVEFRFFSYHVRGDSQAGGGSSSYLLNLGATFAFLRFIRTFIYARLGAGIMLSSPPTIYSGIGFSVLGGVGARVYSRLKHFSFALELLTTLRIPLGGANELAFGMALLPSVIYTF